MNYKYISIVFKNIDRIKYKNDDISYYTQLNIKDVNNITEILEEFFDYTSNKVFECMETTKNVSVVCGNEISTLFYIMIKNGDSFEDTKEYNSNNAVNYMRDVIDNEVNRNFGSDFYYVISSFGVETDDGNIHWWFGDGKEGRLC